MPLINRSTALICFASAWLALPLTAQTSTPQDTPAPAPSSSSSSSSSSGSSLTVTEIPPAARTGKEHVKTSPKRVGIDLHVGLNGVGGDIAVPIAQKFNVRVGGQYIQYTGHFTSDGAQIDASLQLGNGKAGIDWFPFGNGFRISPMMYFALQTQVKGNVIVPAGQQISLAGGDYVSSATDPLRGTALVDSRDMKVAPGLSLGWSNISPRTSAHFSFPVEIGFYYQGQPNLKVTFDGSACDPTQPPAIGCQKVTTDPGFQKDLQRFIDRNNHNLSYAKFFPVAQLGLGYRF